MVLGGGALGTLHPHDVISALVEEETREIITPVEIQAGPLQTRERASPGTMLAP